MAPPGWDRHRPHRGLVKRPSVPAKRGPMSSDSIRTCAIMESRFSDRASALTDLCSVGSELVRRITRFEFDGAIRARPPPSSRDSAIGVVLNASQAGKQIPSIRRTPPPVQSASRSIPSLSRNRARSASTSTSVLTQRARPQHSSTMRASCNRGRELIAKVSALFVHEGARVLRTAQFDVRTDEQIA